MIEPILGGTRYFSVKAFVSLRIALTFMLLAVALSSTADAQSDDVLITANGDRLTGEIKLLDRGMLSFSTDATDTIQVKWTHVAVLISDQNFLITLDDDREVFGTLEPANEDGFLRLRTARLGSIELPVVTVVRMSPVEGRLADQIDFSINLGYNKTKANSVAQGNFGASFGYRTEERLLSSDLQATRSSSTADESSIRLNSTFSYRQFIRDRRWDPIGFGLFERNDELGLKRRMTLGGGMARWLADTNSHRVSFLGGLVATREDEFDALESEDSLEAAMALSLDWFRLDDPEVDVSMTFTTFQRLSDTARTRGNLDVDLRWELVNDFFWGFSTYYSFNTKPTGEETSKTDYGVVTTLGWSF